MNYAVYTFMGYSMIIETICRVLWVESKNSPLLERHKTIGIAKCASRKMIVRDDNIDICKLGLIFAIFCGNIDGSVSLQKYWRLFYALFKKSEKMCVIISSPKPSFARF